MKGTHLDQNPIEHRKTRKSSISVVFPSKFSKGFIKAQIPGFCIMFFFFEFLEEFIDFGRTCAQSRISAHLTIRIDDMSMIFSSLPKRTMQICKTRIWFPNACTSKCRNQIKSSNIQSAKASRTLSVTVSSACSSQNRSCGTRPFQQKPYKCGS